MLRNLICWLVFLSRSLPKRHLAYPWHTLFLLCILLVNPHTFCLAAINTLPQTDNKFSVYQLPTLVLQCYYLKVFSGFLPGIVTAAPMCLSKVQKERLQEQYRVCMGYVLLMGWWRLAAGPTQRRMFGAVFWQTNGFFALCCLFLGHTLVRAGCNSVTV